ACGRNDTTIRRHDATGAFGAFTTSTKLTKDTKKGFVSLFDRIATAGGDRACAVAGPLGPASPPAEEPLIFNPRYLSGLGDLCAPCVLRRRRRRVVVSSPRRASAKRNR